MELDLKYKQYCINNMEEVILPEASTEISTVKRPHQEEIELIEKFKEFYSYKDIMKYLPTIKTNTDLVLEDGTIVHFILCDKVLQIALELKNGNKFACIWTDTITKEELFKSISK